MIPGWLDEIEEEVLACLRARGKMSARELGDALGVSEGSAVHYIYLLASEGRLSIEGVAVPRRREPGPLSACRVERERESEEERHGIPAGSLLG